MDVDPDVARLERMAAAVDARLTEFTTEKARQGLERRRRDEALGRVRRAGPSFPLPLSRFGDIDAALAITAEAPGAAEEVRQMRLKAEANKTEAD